mmetsp:Transcript_54081/g.156194  ORF Transcript_54081/g.156194 Transcript_54081/m.156194 type:complete len:235 (-) Transcript_54081:535-1239(-)
MSTSREFSRSWVSSGSSWLRRLFAASISTAHLITSSISSEMSRTLSICRSAEPAPRVPVCCSRAKHRSASSSLSALRFCRKITDPHSLPIQESHDFDLTGSCGDPSGIGRQILSSLARFRPALFSEVGFSPCLDFFALFAAMTAAAAAIVRTRFCRFCCESFSAFSPSAGDPSWLFRILLNQLPMLFCWRPLPLLSPGSLPRLTWLGGGGTYTLNITPWHLGSERAGAARDRFS